MNKLTEMVRAKIDLDEGLWADKKKAWMATFENNVVSSDGSHQGKIDWHTAQYLHKQNHTPAAAAEAYLKAKGPKAKGVTFEGVELEEGLVPNYATQIKRGHKIKWDKKTYEVTGVNREKYLGTPGISFSLRHASGSEHVTGVMDPLHHITRIAESTETLEEGNPATAILSTLMKKMKKYNDDSAAADKALQHALRTQSGKPRKADGMRPLERMEGFSDTIKKVGKNLAARPNKGSMPAAGRVKKMTEEEEMNEGKMKELSMDLEGPDSLPDKDFHAKYNRTKEEWHGLLGTKPKKPKAPKVVAPTVQKESRLGKDGADEDERSYGEPMGVPSGPGKSPRHAPGTPVSFAGGGKRHRGKVVRHVPRNQHSGESEAYVVDTGEYESKIVPVHRVQKEEVDLGEAVRREKLGKSVPAGIAARYHAALARSKETGKPVPAAVAAAYHSANEKVWVKPVSEEEVDLDEATLPKYDPAKMDEFEAAKEFQYHAGRSAFHRNSQGWTGKLNDIYNRDWKKEATHHERHMKALKKVMDFHKTRKEEAEIDYPTLDEEVELMEGASMADMRPDNINDLIKKHGKRHMVYTGPGEPMQHGLGYKELKAKLGIGVSASVHKKFVSHLEKNGFKSSWSHTSNEWVAHPK